MSFSKVAFACLGAAWGALGQLSILFSQVVAVDAIDVSGETCGVIESFGALPFIVEVRESLPCKLPKRHDFALL